MSLEACAALVEKADPERFRAVMSVAPEARAVLFPIFAFGVEISRAPWVTQEPLIAEMRLQWWRDALEEIAAGGPVRGHEVTQALQRVLDAEGARLLDRAVAARRWDIHAEPFEDAADFDAYIEDTSAGPLWVAARALGSSDEAAVRRAGWGIGLARFLAAVPELEARGRVPLVDGRPEAVAGLARRGLASLSEGRAARDPGAVAALRSGWCAAPMLARAARDPGAVARGELAVGPLASSLRLAWQSARGRWG